MVNPRRLTGDHVADLHDMARSNGCRFLTTSGLPAPWVTDHRCRTVWVDGSLKIDLWVEAIATGLAELIGSGATITQLHPRRDRQRSTG